MLATCLGAQKIFHSKKNLGSKRYFWVKKFSVTKKKIGFKKFWVKKKFWFKKILVQKIFGLKKIVGPKKISGKKKIEWMKFGWKSVTYWTFYGTELPPPLFSSQTRHAKSLFVPGLELEFQILIFGNGHSFPNTIYEFWNFSSKCQYLEI